VKRIVEADRTLAEQIRDFFNEFVAAVNDALDALQGTGSWKQLRALRKDRDTLAAIAEVFEAALEGAVDGEGSDNVMLSAADSHYDYSKPFAEQVDDWIAGKIPKRDTLVLGGTPEVLKNIGFSALPLTINQTHVDYAINNTKDADHFLEKDVLKKLPALIENPIAVIRSETHPDSSVVVIVGEIVNGKQMIAAVAVDGFGHVNYERIDSNAVTTVFGKDNALYKLQNALQNHSEKSTEVYYWNKKIASALLKGARLQLPGRLPQGGYIGSIRSAASKVNTRIDRQTDTLQFKRWFGNSKTVNKDGKPMVMYHYSDAEDIDIYDMSRIGSNQGTSLGDGIYMSTSPQAFSGEAYGKYRHDWYAAIKKPYDATRGLSRRQAEYVVEKYGAIKHDIEAFDGLYKSHAVEKLMNPLRALDYIKEYAKDAGIKTSDIFEDLDYDGIKNGNEWVAFKQTQIKSATKNIGLFDGDNTKLNFSKKDDAVSTFGTTFSWNETGYITTDGKQLDFSGKRDGAPGGYRSMDHRDVVEIYGEDTDMSGAEAMVAFMGEGNIRISPESGGINLSVMPTKAQREKLQAFIRRNNGEVIVDFDDADGNTVHSVEYPAGTGAVRITNDIDRYFKEGAKPEVSIAQQFHFSKKDIADYTEKEYDSYGWAVVNEVLDETEQAALFDRLSDKKNGTSFERTHDKKYIFPVGEEFGVNNVLVVSNGNYYKPSIERIHRIMLDNETDIDIVRRYLYAAEKQGNRAVQALRSHMDEDIFESHYRTDFPTYQEVRSTGSRKPGSGSQTVEGDHREQRNGRENDPEDRGTGLIFSMKDTTPADLTAVQEENESLNSALRLTEEFAKLIKGHARAYYYGQYTKTQPDRNVFHSNCLL